MTVYVMTTDQEDRAFEVETFCCRAALEDEFKAKPIANMTFDEMLATLDPETAHWINETPGYAEQVGCDKAEKSCSETTPGELTNLREYYTTSAERTETAGVR